MNYYEQTKQIAARRENFEGKYINVLQDYHSSSAVIKKSVLVSVISISRKWLVLLILGVLVSGCGSSLPKGEMKPCIVSESTLKYMKWLSNPCHKTARSVFKYFLLRLALHNGYKCQNNVTGLRRTLNYKIQC